MADIMPCYCEDQPIVLLLRGLGFISFFDAGIYALMIPFVEIMAAQWLFEDIIPATNPNPAQRTLHHCSRDLRNDHPQQRQLGGGKWHLILTARPSGSVRLCFFETLFQTT